MQRRADEKCVPSEKSFSPVLSTVCLVGAVNFQDCDQGHNDKLEFRSVIRLEAAVSD